MLSQSRLACEIIVLSPYPVPTAVFLSLWFCLHFLSVVWVANVRPAVVLFYNPALLVLRLIFPCFMPDDGTRHHLYLIAPYVPVSGSHLVSAFPYYHHPVVVCSALSSLALAHIVCAYYFFCPVPFHCVYFFIEPFFPSSVYIPPLTFVPLILCYLTCIPHGAINRTHPTPSHPPFYPFAYICGHFQKKEKPWIGRFSLWLWYLACHILIPFCVVGKFLDIP